MSRWKWILWVGLLAVVALICLVVEYSSSAMEVVVGAVISIWITMLVEAIQKPDLHLVIWQGELPQRMGFGGEPGYVVHLHLVNKPLPWVFRWLQRASATETSGTITFRDDLEAKPVAKKMPVRWSNSPQPGRVIRVRCSDDPPFRMEIWDPERLTVIRQIPPGFSQAGVLGVALRLDHGAECYGVTNESYFTGWKPPDLKLPLPRYLVDVEIVASNASCEGVFLLVKDGLLSKDIALATASRRKRSKVRKRRREEESYQKPE